MRFQFTRPRGARPRFLSRLRRARVSIHAPTGGATIYERLTRWLRAFQFTRPRGARHLQGFELQAAKKFQFTRPRGARRGCEMTLSMCNSFNSRAHGGRDNGVHVISGNLFVSIHAPTGGATRRQNLTTKEMMFQFTRPRGARLYCVRFAFARGVSIHAPTGGATVTSTSNASKARFNSRAHGGRDFRTADDSNVQISFNSRAHGGRDSQMCPRKAILRRFNSRAHGGRDGKKVPLSDRLRFQFTRPRGARPWRHLPPSCAGCFNSRAHGGRDSSTPISWTIAARGFNSRAHGGRDCSPSPASRTRTRFNSRAHGGRDVVRIVLAIVGVVSIHAPTGGATDCIVYLPFNSGFQFTRPRGARLCHGGTPTLLGAFQFTRPRGARRMSKPGTLAILVSIHAPTGGATSFRRPARTALRVSIHAPTGGATLCAVAVQGVYRGFNSRAHGGRDFESSDTGSWAEVSIHAPTGGATRTADDSNVQISFNSRAHGGRDMFPRDWRRTCQVSIHAPTGGATAYILSYPIVDLQGGFPRTCPFFGLSSLIVNDQVFCARRERPILLPRTS